MVVVEGGGVGRGGREWKMGVGGGGGGWVGGGGGVVEVGMFIGSGMEMFILTGTSDHRD